MSEPKATTRPPLGLPRGSVRAILTLFIVAVVIVDTMRDQPITVLWTETLMIALAHYFTSRRFLQLPPEIIRRLQDEGHLPRERNPLFLPRHTIRGLIILAFVGLAVWLYREDRLLSPNSLSVVGMVFAYVLGIMFKGALNWWNRKLDKEVSPLWGDLKALLVLAAVTSTAVTYLMGRPDLVPKPMHDVTLGLTLFYFGSR